MFLRGQPVRKQASAFYPTARSRLSGLLFPCRIDFFLPHPGSMFLRLRAFLPQEVEQIVRIGLPPGHAYEPFVQFAESFPPICPYCSTGDMPGRIPYLSSSCRLV